MGKFISKISPTINSGQLVQAANTKVSRKVLYRRLQSPRPFHERSIIGTFDFVHFYWGFGFILVLIWILDKRGESDDPIPNGKDKWIMEKNIYELAKEGFLNRNKKEVTDDTGTS